MDVTIYHNPRCSKSREALQMLEDAGISPRIVLYLETPLSIDELRLLYGRLGLETAHEMLRVKEPEYKEAGLSEKSSDSEILAAIATYPKLLERPIVVTDKGAAICRPPERIQALIA